MSEHQSRPSERPVTSHAGAIRMGQTTRRFFRHAGLMLIPLLGACASIPAGTNEELALARAAIERAEQEDARALATSDMNRATGKYEKAKKALEDREFERAKMLAEQSRLDAEYSVITARAAKATEAAAQVDETIRTLETEINRTNVR